VRRWRGVRQRARPSPVPRLSGNAGAHRVEIDISHRCKQVRGIESAGKITIVPKVPHAVTIPILLQGVLRMRVAKCPRQRFRRSGNRDQMNVIGHKAPSKNADIAAPGMVAKYLKIADSVLIGEEDVLPIVAALGNVMRSAR